MAAAATWPFDSDEPRNSERIDSVERARAGSPHPRRRLRSTFKFLRVSFDPRVPRGPSWTSAPGGTKDSDAIPRIQVTMIDTAGGPAHGPAPGARPHPHASGLMPRLCRARAGLAASRDRAAWPQAGPPSPHYPDSHDPPGPPGPGRDRLGEPEREGRGRPPATRGAWAARAVAAPPRQ
jgi:hypothetical protein